MKIILVFFTLLTSFFYTSISAAENETLPKGDFSKMKRSDIVTVSQIINPQTLQLHDGRIIRLSGINYPDYNTENTGKFSLMAMDILRDMLEGESVTLYHTQKKNLGRMNRMGHHLVQLERQKDGVWIQGTLLTLGLARVYTTQRNPEMSAQMYAFEDTARNEKLGIWEDETYKILTPETAIEHLNSFQIIEGLIESTALKNNRIYLNFGKNWKTDFTVSIAPADKRIFSKQGIDPLQWNNKTIRVRGWVESYNGAYIEINHPQAIEVIE
ncbi:MAG: thermonuclease family protein [Alphaproteobacteria bacterium]|nr:thermonuclease family protein [Alphaproteobacteria bacterium]